MFPLLNMPITSRRFPRTDILPYLVLTVRFRACKRLNDFPSLCTYGLCTANSAILFAQFLHLAPVRHLGTLVVHLLHAFATARMKIQTFIRYCRYSCFLVLRTVPWTRVKCVKSFSHMLTLCLVWRVSIITNTGMTYWALKLHTL